jgi:SagB-type dehydrogenase family enzyme
MGRYNNYRNFLKSNFDEFDNTKTDKASGITQPPITKSYDSSEVIINLPEISEEILKNENIYSCIKERRSVRLYSEEKLTLEELSYLLWSTQGINNFKNVPSLRTVPCSGATHSFETYLFIMNVHDIKKGIYRYLPIEHKLLFMFELENIDEKVDIMTLDQPFVPHFANKAAVIFAWSTIPYRSEWKFDITAHKKILIDAGHVCQNLYLASESIEAGACAIGIYDQKMIDDILNLDGEDEFVVYLSAVGKKIR